MAVKWVCDKCGTQVRRYIFTSMPSAGSCQVTGVGHVWRKA